MIETGLTPLQNNLFSISYICSDPNFPIKRLHHKKLEDQDSGVDWGAKAQQFLHKRRVYSKTFP